MIRSIQLLLALFAISGFTNPVSRHDFGSRITDHNPITAFKKGSYLGEGHYVTSNGYKGSYATHAMLMETGWKLSYLQNGKLTTYKAVLNFSENGEFEAMVTKVGDDNLYFGEGYCGAVQCHIDATIDNVEFEDTVTFLEDQNLIYRFGSVTHTLADDSRQRMIWQEHMYRLPSDDEDDQ